MEIDVGASEEEIWGGEGYKREGKREKRWEIKERDKGVGQRILRVLNLLPLLAAFEPKKLVDL